MTKSKMTRLINGPYDGNLTVIDGKELKVFLNPFYGLFPLAGDNKIEYQTGHYIKSEDGLVAIWHGPEYQS